MKKASALKEEMKDDQLTECIQYLLAGLTGHTSGHKITSVAVQQAGLSGYRVIIRAVGADSDGNTIFAISYTIASEPGAALLLAEAAYRDDAIQWKVDRFAKSISDNGPSKNERGRLVLTD